MKYHGIEFASSIPSETTGNLNVGGALNLAPHVSEEVKMALNDLPCFAYADTGDLMKEAEAKLCNKRRVSDRFTAMLVIAGTRYLNHSDLQIPRKRK